jgi:hypothetical protein
VTISYGSTMVRVRFPEAKPRITRDPRIMAFDANGMHVPSVESFLNRARKDGRHVTFIRRGSKVRLVSRGTSLFFSG